MIGAFNQYRRLTTQQKIKLLRPIFLKLTLFVRALIRMMMPILILFFFFSFYTNARNLQDSLNKDSETQQKIKTTIHKFEQKIDQRGHITFLEDNSIYKKITKFYNQELEDESFYILYGPSGIGKSRSTIHYFNHKSTNNRPFLYVNLIDLYFEYKQFKITQDQSLSDIIKWKSQPNSYFSKWFQKHYNQKFGNTSLTIVFDGYFIPTHAELNNAILIRQLYKLRFQGIKIVIISQHSSFTQQFQQFLYAKVQHLKVKKLGTNKKQDIINVLDDINIKNFKIRKFIINETNTMRKIVSLKINCLQQFKKIDIIECLKFYSKQFDRFWDKYLRVMKVKQNNLYRQLFRKLCLNPNYKLKRYQKQMSKKLEDEGIFFDDYFVSLQALRFYEKDISKNQMSCKISKRFLS